MPSQYLRIVVCVVIAIFAAVTVAAGDAPPLPGPKDRCAICGMFVAKYPAWIATIEFADGTLQFFDGPKDLFRYLAREEVSAESAEIWVTDYYTTKPVKARDVLFVVGSDVLGPMGAELIPLTSARHAESFRADHGGDAPLTFDAVDDTVLGSLE